MAINLQEALTSKAYAYKCYYNYNNGNTMGITAEDYGRIIGKWGNETVLEWQKYMAKDENAYELSDEEFDNAYDRGKDKAKDAAGYDGKTGGQIAGAAGHAVGGLGVGILGGAGQLSSTLRYSVGSGINKIMPKAGEKLGEKFGEVAGIEKLSDIVTVTLAAVVAATYWATQPNKEAVEALKVLNEEELPASQAALQDAQAAMDEAAEETMELAEEAEEKNEEGNEKITNEKVDNDAYLREYQELKNKQNLTPEEKARMQKLRSLMNEKSDNVNSIAEETSEVVGDLHEEMADYQESYDESAETIGEVQGVTDYAEGFDTTTKWTSMAEMVSQGLNAAGAAMAAARLVGKVFVGWIFAGIGFAAAAASGVAVVKETQNMKVAGTEINTREATQDMNDETTDIYDEEIDIYEGIMEEVGDLTLEIPDEIGAPEDEGDTTLVPPEDNATLPEDDNKDGKDKDPDKEE